MAPPSDPQHTCGRAHRAPNSRHAEKHEVEPEPMRVICPFVFLMVLSNSSCRVFSSGRAAGGDMELVPARMDMQRTDQGTSRETFNSYTSLVGQVDNLVGRGTPRWRARAGNAAGKVGRQQGLDGEPTACLPSARHSGTWSWGRPWP